VSAADVELAPFAGLQFGGSFDSNAFGRSSIGSGLAYGATVDVAVARSWRVEALYSRQATEVAGSRGGSRFEMSVERYMAGIEEEKASGKTRFFGTFLMGLTRFSPGLSGFDADERFTLSVSLGIKRLVSERFGFRVESRAFLVIVEAGAGAFCSGGTCLFRYSASGLWQGDVTGAVVFAF
jgi:hypothetical protein